MLWHHLPACAVLLAVINPECSIHHHAVHRRGFGGPSSHMVTGKVWAADPRAPHTWLVACHAPSRTQRLCLVPPAYSHTPGISASGWETHWHVSRIATERDLHQAGEQGAGRTALGRGRRCTHQVQEMSILLPGRRNHLPARSSTSGNTALPSFRHQNLDVYFTPGVFQGRFFVCFNSCWVHVTNFMQARFKSS